MGSRDIGTDRVPPAAEASLGAASAAPDPAPYLTSAGRAELLRLTGFPVPLRVSVQSLRKLERDGLVRSGSTGWRLLPAAAALVPAPVFADVTVGDRVVLAHGDDGGSIAADGVAAHVDLDGHRIAVLTECDERPWEFTSWEGVRVLHVGAGGRLRTRQEPDGTITVLDHRTGLEIATGLSATDIASLWVQIREAVNRG